MFEKDASGAFRMDYARVGKDFLQGNPEDYTVQDVAKAVKGIAAGLNMMAEEFSQLLQVREIPIKHSNATFEDARTGGDAEVNPMLKATSFSAINAPVKASNPQAYVTTNCKVKGAAIVANGPIVALQANNLNANDGDTINKAGFIGPAGCIPDILVDRLHKGNQASFFDIGHFHGDNAPSATTINSNAPVTISLTNQVLVGDKVSAAAALTAGTYAAFGQMSVRQVLGPASGVIADNIVGKLLIGSTEVNELSVSRPASSRGDGTSAVFSCMFNTQTEQTLSMTAVQEAGAISGFRFNQEKTGFVVVKIPT